MTIITPTNERIEIRTPNADEANLLHIASELVVACETRTSGRPGLPDELRSIIERMATANPVNEVLAELMELSSGFDALRGQANWIAVSRRIYERSLLLLIGPPLSTS